MIDNYLQNYNSCQLISIMQYVELLANSLDWQVIAKNIVFLYFEIGGNSLML